MKPAWIALATGTAALLLNGLPGHAQVNSLQERRLLMRQVTQQWQSRLDQRLRCVNSATSLAELERCERTSGGGWHHGSGMGVWGCPMW